MFITHKKDFIPSFVGNDMFIFSGIEIAAYSPWFICEVPEYEDGDDEAICTTTHLIADIDTLAEFCQLRKIEKTYLVSPGHLNSSESWALARLLKVSKAQYDFDGGKKQVYRFETENGTIFENDLSGLNKLVPTLTFQTILTFQ